MKTTITEITKPKTFLKALVLGEKMDRMGQYIISVTEEHTPWHMETLNQTIAETLALHTCCLHMHNKSVDRKPMHNLFYDYAFEKIKNDPCLRKDIYNANYMKTFRNLKGDKNNNLHDLPAPADSKESHPYYIHD